MLESFQSVALARIFDFAFSMGSSTHFRKLELVKVGALMYRHTVLHSY